MDNHSSRLAVDYLREEICVLKNSLATKGFVSMTIAQTFGAKAKQMAAGFGRRVATIVTPETLWPGIGS